MQLRPPMRTIVSLIKFRVFFLVSDGDRGKFTKLTRINQMNRRELTWIHFHPLQHTGFLQFTNDTRIWRIKKWLMTFDKWTAPRDVSHLLPFLNTRFHPFDTSFLLAMMYVFFMKTNDHMAVKNFFPPLYSVLLVRRRGLSLLRHSPSKLRSRYLSPSPSPYNPYIFLTMIDRRANRNETFLHAIYSILFTSTGIPTLPFNPTD